MCYLQQHMTDVAWFYFFMTNDGGVTWTYLPYLTFVGRFGIGNLAFLDGQSGFLTDETGRHVLRLDLAARKWRPVGEIGQGEPFGGNSAVELPNCQLDFLTPKVGWLLRTAIEGRTLRTELWATSDGASNWNCVYSKSRKIDMDTLIRSSE